MRNVELFNSPLETGLRSLVLLASCHPAELDLQRLLYYDYLVVHSGDVDGGPESIHPAAPGRSGQLLVRRELVAEGLRLMQSRELVRASYSERGIGYAATELGKPFLDHFASDYALQLEARARWVTSTFSNWSSDRLEDFIQGSLDGWGGELVTESYDWVVDGG